jgi:trans-aconitate methyltransferase
MTNVSSDRWVAGDAYEVYMGRWSRPVARAFLEWLHAEPSANWLEVGCGTGALTSTICQLCAPASVVACDLSEPFVGHARRQLSDARVTFHVAGADALPRRDGGFDVAVSGLVLNFLPDPGATVASLRERLRSGGVVAGYVWDYADGMEFLRLFWDEAGASAGPWRFRPPSPPSTTTGRHFSEGQAQPPATWPPWMLRAVRD